jgi:hypothetical protein
MPEISRFYGIVIKVFHNDHHPPHFHAEHGSDQMLVEIETLGVIAGKLPPRAMGLATPGRIAARLGAGAKPGAVGPH